MPALDPDHAVDERRIHPVLARGLADPRIDERDPLPLCRVERLGCGRRIVGRSRRARRRGERGLGVDAGARRGRRPFDPTKTRVRTAGGADHHGEDQGSPQSGSRPISSIQSSIHRPRLGRRGSLVRHVGHHRQGPRTRRKFRRCRPLPRDRIDLHLLTYIDAQSAPRQTSQRAGGRASWSFRCAIA